MDFAAIIVLRLLSSIETTHTREYTTNRATENNLLKTCAPNSDRNNSFSLLILLVMICVFPKNALPRAVAYLLYSRVHKIQRSYHVRANQLFPTLFASPRHVRRIILRR